MRGNGGWDQSGRGGGKRPQVLLIDRMWKRKNMVSAELPGAQWLRGICLDGRPRDLGMWEKGAVFRHVARDLWPPREDVRCISPEFTGETGLGVTSLGMTGI